MPLVVWILAFFGHWGFVIRHWQYAGNMKAKIQDATKVAEVTRSGRSRSLASAARASVARRDNRRGIRRRRFVAIDTDAASLAASTAPVKIHLETKLLRGLGTGGDPERGRALAEEQFATFKTACEGADVIFILAGLGGGAGSGIIPVLARAAKETGALVLAFVTLPFACEGNRRQQQAQQSLAQTQGRRRRRHLSAEPEGVQVD